MNKILPILFIMLAAGNCHSEPYSHELRPAADTFVLNPGPGNVRHIDAAKYNYGGAGSRSISSANAYAILEDGLTLAPKGEYISLLKFDFTELAGKYIDSITLSLYISNGNRAAYDIFNYAGNEGYFDVSWVANYWEQGTGAPHEIVTYPYNSLNGVNFISLQELLDMYPPRLLETFYYTAENPYGQPEWFGYTFDFSNGNYNQLRMAVSQGQTVSFMLSASEDSDVCFNFSAYNQTWQDTINYRENGPKLIVNGNTGEPHTENSYSAACVNGEKNVGGLVGFDSSGIENSYFCGNVTGDFNDPNNNIGPVAGSAKAGTFNTYWNIDTVDLPLNIIAGGLTEEQMTDQSSFKNWNFSDLSDSSAEWKMLRNNEDYPRLAWQYEFPGDLTGKYGVDQNDLTVLLENWLNTKSDGQYNISDIDRDSITNITDFAVLAADWLNGLQ